ncbi:MAG: glycosyl hydrolase [Cyanobacteria bacterium P01_D01_bin.2]
MNDKRYFFLGLMAALLLGLWSPGVWAHDPHDVAQQVELSPNYKQDQSVYALVRGNFLKSTDSGTTWQRQVRGLDHKRPLVAFAIAPTSPSHLYLTTAGDGLYESEDSGETWRRSNQGLPELSLDQVAVSAAGVVFVAGHDGNLYRRRGENNWTLALSTTTPVSAIATTPDFVVIGDRQGQLYSSTDGGKTWSGLATAASAITSISLPDTNATQQFWIGTAGHGILQTLDGGKTLRDASRGLPETAVQDVVSATSNSQVILYTSTASQGVFYSDDGDTWQPMDSGLTTTPQADKMGHPHFSDLALSPDFDADGTVLASGFDGLFKTTDRGDSWTQLDTLPGDIVVALALSPNYASDQTLVALTYVGEAYISRTDGNSWSPMAKGLELPYFTDTFAPIPRNDDPRRFQSLAFSPNYAQDNTLFATILNNGVLSYSDRQGWRLRRFEAWERAAAIAPSPNFAEDNTLFVSTQAGNIYRSSGKTFNKISAIDRQRGNESPFMVVSPDYGRDQTVFVTGPAGVYKTTDSGLSWRVMTAEVEFQDRLKLKLAISPGYAQDRTLWLGTSNGLLQTQDGGETWTEVATLGDTPYIEAVAVSPSYKDDQTLMVSVRGQRVFKSTDGGRTFVAIGETAPPLAIVNNFEYGAMPLVFSPNYAQDQILWGFGAVRGELFKSSDGGQTWRTIALPDAEIFDNHSDHRYSLLSQVLFFFHIYRMPLLKLSLACVAGIICYALLSIASGYLKILRLRLPMQIGAAVVMTGVAIAALFI